MKQITIVVKDRPGLVADISDLLLAAGVNIDSIVAEQVGGSAAIILTVDRYDAALRALANTPFQAVTEDAILVRLDDRPGMLAQIAHRFKEAGINLRSIRTVSRDAGGCIVAIAAERTKEAMELVKDVLIS
jgi:hypothetical protein